MDKKGIFDKVIGITADVCMVEKDDIINGKRGGDVVAARSIVVFWLTAAGFSVESIKGCADVDNSSQINAIKARIEEYWVTRYAYHMLVKEVADKMGIAQTALSRIEAGTHSPSLDTIERYADALGMTLSLTRK